MTLLLGASRAMDQVIASLTDSAKICALVLLTSNLISLLGNMAGALSYSAVHPHTDRERVLVPRVARGPRNQGACLRLHLNPHIRRDQLRANRDVQLLGLLA